MPVRKFKSLDDMRATAWLDRDDPQLGRKLASLWEFCSRLTGPLPVARGVHRFRTIEEMNAHRLTWDRLRVEELQRRRANAKAKSSSLE
jgi:hypothetical protein